MALNKNYFVATRKVMFGDQEIGTFRGVTPNDIARVLSENAADMDELVSLVRRDQAFAKIDHADAARIAAMAEENADMLFGKIVLQVPNLVAKVIAVAADEPESADFIRDNVPLPAQFDAMLAIAELTFVSTKNFKDFLGKTMALVGNLKS